jgi:hypothetical protein
LDKTLLDNIDPGRRIIQRQERSPRASNWRLNIEHYRKLLTQEMDETKRIPWARAGTSLDWCEEHRQRLSTMMPLVLQWKKLV